MKIDLHTHSTASDGQYNPAKLVELAVKNDIRLFSLTDHDTLGGIKEAYLRSEELGLCFVPGIEISTQDIEEIHILGYDIDYTAEELNQSCSIWQEARLNRGEIIRKYLKTRGIDIDLDEVYGYAKDRSLGRPHFAQYLQNHGIVSTRKEAFDYYLDTEEFRKATDRPKPNPEEAIGLIHRAHGKALLAHPGIYRMNESQMEDLIKRLVDVGLDGIECFYSKHTLEQTNMYLSYVKQLNLKSGCGSDYHGESVKPDIVMGMNFDYKKWSDILIVNQKGEIQ